MAVWHQWRLMIFHANVFIMILSLYHIKQIYDELKKDTDLSYDKIFAIVCIERSEGLTRRKTLS
jgi:hypothetical protein